MGARDNYFDVFYNADKDRHFITLIIGDNREDITWGSFRSLAFHHAKLMRDAGVGPGDVVLIFYPHQRLLLPAFFAAQLIGAVPSFMPALSPRQDLALFRTSHEELIAAIQPALICADAATAQALGRQSGVLKLEDIDVSQGGSDITLAPAARDVPALLQHSSGTTGLKKGVELGYEAIMAQLDSYGLALQLNGSETVVSWLPVYHDMGLIAATLLPFVTGTPAVLMSAFDWLARPWRLLEEMASVSAPLTWLPNFAFATMAKAASRLPAEARLDHVKAFISCSEPAKAATMDQFQTTFAGYGVRPEHLQICYAMAENTFAVTQTPLGIAPSRWFSDSDVGSTARPILSCGRAIPGAEIQIRDGDSALEEGKFGEVHVAGSSLFAGYRGQRDLTTRKLRDGWYATGDIGALRAGELYVSGRTDDVIIVAGRSLFAHSVEDEISSVPGIRPGRVCSFGVHNELSGTERLVVLAEAIDEQASVSDLEREVRQRVSGSLLVSSARVVILPRDTLIKTTSGKMSRSENRARYERNELKSWGNK